MLTFILADVMPPHPDPVGWMGFLGTVGSALIVLISLGKFFITPLAERVKSLEDSNKEMKEEIVAQVIAIADANHEHRLEQHKSCAEIRLLLSDNYVRKTDFEPVFTIFVHQDEFKATIRRFDDHYQFCPVKVKAESPEVGRE